MRSGLPATEQFGGVPFTVRLPHHIGTEESMVFGGPESHSQDGSKFPNEALLVICLPKSLVQPLPSFENKPFLCQLPSQCLTAMRAQNPSGVLDVKPGYAASTLHFTNLLVSRSAHSPICIEFQF